MAIKTNLGAKSKAQHAVETVDQVPTGQCPLCFTDNAYMNSICVECSLPLPWAKAAPAEREPSGQCMKCSTYNSYTTLNCTECGGRLPWANAVSPNFKTPPSAGFGPAALPAAPSVYTYYSPPVGGNMLPAAPGAMVNGSGSFSGGSASGPGNSTLVSMDSPIQAIDIISFISPILGFVAYVALLGQMPRVAISAGQKALYGLCLWIPVVVIWLMLGHSPLGGKSYTVPTPAKTPVPVVASTAWSTSASSSGAPSSAAAAAAPVDNTD